MSTGNLSKARLGRMHGVLAGHVERGEVPGLVALDFWTSAYQAIDD